MSEPKNSIRINGESDKWQTTSIVPVPPTWRDVWAILRGRYVPLVRKESRLTVAGTDRLLRQVYTSDRLVEEMYDRSPFAALLGEQGTVPIHKKADTGDGAA